MTSNSLSVIKLVRPNVIGEVTLKILLLSGTQQ